MYNFLLTVVVVGKVTPIAVNIALKAILLALPSSLILMINFWPWTGEPVGAAIVKPSACAVITAKSVLSASTVNVAVDAVELTIGLITAFLLILFWCPESPLSSIINS